MPTRRDCLRRLTALTAGAVALPLLAACGGEGDGPATSPDTTAPPPESTATTAAAPGGATIALAEVERTAPDAAATRPAVAALAAFSADLYRQLAAGEGNRIASPYSALVALGMTRTGALGATATEMDAVLHAPAPAPDALNAGLNALAQTLAARAGAKARADGSTAEIALDVANALWAQRGLRFEDAFLAALGRDYGAGVQLVDYREEPEAARGEINAWVAEQTRDRIEDLVPEGAITPDTRLVLTNAIYLKAPWEEPFVAESTVDAPFTRLDGTAATVPMMRGGGRLAYAAGDGHARVTLPYAGQELAMTLVVPDAGRFPEVEASLSGDALQAWLAPAEPRTVDLSLPRFTFRAKASLADALAALGMPRAFSDDAEFAGMTAEEELKIGDVIHEAFIAVDEEGTEAAAATAVIMETTSAAPEEPVQLVIDRPFLLVIHDVATAAPLFLGRVVDPLAT